MRLNRWAKGAIGCGATVFLLLAGLVGYNLARNFGRWGAEGRSPITVSHETTFVTGPLREDGYIDYYAAVDEETRKGIATNENAAVPLWEAIGPLRLPESIRTRYLKRLGLAELPMDGEYFVRFEDFSDTSQPYEVAAAELDQATRRPWSAEESPEVAKWLQVNEKSLERAAAASRRSKYYSPVIAVDDSSLLMEVLLPGAKEVGELARALNARAMLRVEAGAVEGAWQDALAARRLGRLMGQSPFLVTRAVGYAIEVQSSHVTAAVGHYGEAPVEVVHFRDDLRALPLYGSLADSVDRVDRLVTLDTATSMARDRPGALDSTRGSSQEGRDTLFGQFSWTNADWDEALRTINQWYDRLVAASRRTSHADRSAAFSDLIADLRLLEPEIKASGIETAVGSFFYDTRKLRGQILGKILILFLMPAVATVDDAAAKASAYAACADTALVLAQFRTATGTYPARLEELVPEYLERLPADPFGNGPFRYKVEGEGYLLYSVGVNGKDDEGRERAAGSDAPSAIPDDLALRMPVEPAQESVTGSP